MDADSESISGKRTGAGLQRVLRATAFSLAGLRSAWLHEAAFRQECWAAAVLVPAAFWVGQDAVQRALLIGTCMLVLIVELLNSAVEAVVDRIGTDHHTLAGRAKDLGSAAVFMSLVLLGTVWALIAVERLT